jgi:hypothetical protein
LIPIVQNITKISGFDDDFNEFEKRNDYDELRLMAEYTL